MIFSDFLTCSPRLGQHSDHMPSTCSHACLHVNTTHVWCLLEDIVFHKHLTECNLFVPGSPQVSLKCLMAFSCIFQVEIQTDGISKAFCKCHQSVTVIPYSFAMCDSYKPCAPTIALQLCSSEPSTHFRLKHPTACNNE